jgi:hypothetical protein
VTLITLSMPVTAAKHPEAAVRSIRMLGERLLKSKVCKRPIFTITEDVV